MGIRDWFKRSAPTQTIEYDPDQGLTRETWDSLPNELRAVLPWNVYGSDDYGSRSNSGTLVNEETAFRFGVVYAAVTLIADGVASLPPRAFTEADDGTRTTQVVPQWIRKPHPEIRRFDVFAQLLVSALTWGDGFAKFIRRPSDGVIVGLMPLDPSDMNVEWDPDKPGYRRYRQGGTGPWLSSYDIFHIQGPTLPGSPTGMSVIRYAREAIGLGLTLEEYGARYFGQGSQAKIVLEIPTNIDETKAKDIVRTFERFHKGKNNWHRPAIVSGGAKLHQISIPPDDAQFLQSREHQAIDIARWFRVPPHRVGIISASTSWGSGLAEENMAMLQHTYRPWITRLQDALTMYAPGGQDLGTIIELETDALVKGTFKELSDIWVGLYEKQVVTKNEARQKLGLSKVDKGDEFFEPPASGRMPPTSADKPGAGGRTQEQDRLRKQEEATRSDPLISLLEEDEEGFLDQEIRINPNHDKLGNLTYDEWDGLLITEWFEADPGAPVPASSREGEFEFCFENPAAWDFVDYGRIGFKKEIALEIISSESRFLVLFGEARINTKHDKLGKFAKSSGTALADKPASLSNRKADDLAKRVQDPDGGFTVDPRTGKDVKEGYAVAIYPDRSKEIPHKAVNRQVIQDYAENNKDLLVQDGNMMGGWHDPDSGNVWLDVSRVTNDKREAISLAKEHNQIAIFDLGSGNSINTGGTGRSSYPFVFTRANPYHDKAGKFAAKNGSGYVEGKNQIVWAEKVTMDMNNDPIAYSGNISDPVSRPLVGIAKQQKFDGLPTHGSVDDAIAGGGLEIHRGLTPSRSGRSAEDLEHEFMDGKYEPGKGNYGNGYYFTTSPGIAKMYSKGRIADGGYNTKDVEDGLVIRAALHKNAKIIDYDAIEPQYKEWWDANKDRIHWDTHSTNYVIPEGKISPILTDVFNDPGQFAAILGYDAIRVPLKNRATDRRNKARIKKKIGSDDLGDEIIVLNRTALVVEKRGAGRV